MNEAWPHKYKERRFGVLLSILLVLLAGPPILIGIGLGAVWFDGLMSVLMLAAIVSLCFEPQQRLFALLLGIPSILFSLGGHLLPGTIAAWPLFLGHLCEVLFLLGSAVLIVKSLFGSRAISFDSILGAICGYLFLGLGWAVIYSMIEYLRPGSFEIDQSLAPGGAAARPLSDVLTYYSFVTLTTVGYGDVVPASPATRTCAWIEAITGQFYLAVIVAGLVSILVSRNRNAQDGGEVDSE
jgi:voltage-gated potassium channel